MDLNSFFPCQNSFVDCCQAYSEAGKMPKASFSQSETDSACLMTDLGLIPLSVFFHRLSIPPLMELPVAFGRLISVFPPEDCSVVRVISCIFRKGVFIILVLHVVGTGTVKLFFQWKLVWRNAPSFLGVIFGRFTCGF